MVKHKRDVNQREDLKKKKAQSCDGRRADTYVEKTTLWNRKIDVKNYLQNAGAFDFLMYGIYLYFFCLFGLSHVISVVNNI